MPSARCALGVAGCGQRCDVGRLDTPPGNRGICRRQTGPGEKRLDTAGAPAIARRARGFVFLRPGKRIVTPLSRDAMPSFEHAAVHHNPAARAGAENDAEHRVRTLRGAVGRLRQREAVRVVRNAHGAFERAREIAIERLTDQPRRVRVLDQPGRCGNGAGNADADCSRRSQFAFDRRDELRTAEIVAA